MLTSAQGRTRSGPGLKRAGPGRGIRAESFEDSPGVQAKRGKRAAATPTPARTPARAATIMIDFTSC